MAKIDHIQALIDHDMRLTIYCPNNHYHEVDLQKLGQWLGFGHSTMHADLAHKLWCPVCGSNEIGMLLSKGQAAKEMAPTWGVMPP